MKAQAPALGIEPRGLKDSAFEADAIPLCDAGIRGYFKRKEINKLCYLFVERLIII